MTDTIQTLKDMLLAHAPTLNPEDVDSAIALAEQHGVSPAVALELLIHAYNADLDTAEGAAQFEQAIGATIEQQSRTFDIR